MSTINLLPEDFTKRSSQRRANILCAVLFGITMIAVVAAELNSEQVIARTQAVRDQVDANYAEAARQLQQMQELEARRQNMLNKAEAASALLERVPRSHVLGMITNCLPQQACLTRFDLDAKRAVGAAAVRPTAGQSKFESLTSRISRGSPSQVSINVVGTAATDVEVAKFIANLARNPMIASVDLVYSQEKVQDKAHLREFQIRMELKPQADALNSVPVVMQLAQQTPSRAVAGVKE